MVFQNFVVSFIFFLAVPLIYSKMVLGEPLKNIGWQSGKMSIGILTSIISLVVAGMVIVGLAWQFPAFNAGYVFPVQVERSFFWFVLYEVGVVAMIVVLYEVFFRGFIQIFWLRSAGRWAVIVQSIIFISWVLWGGVEWGQVPLVVFCPFAGYIAYQTQSIKYSFFASWLFLFLNDVFFLIFR